MTITSTILNTIPGNPLDGLRYADSRWSRLRHPPRPDTSVVEVNATPLTDIDWDMIVCGGTLGILIATVLVQRGWKVAIIEQTLLQGRKQEWNISRTELQVLIELGLLTDRELEQAIASSYNPARISFLGGPDFWIRDVLNVGVDPSYLLSRLKQRFLQFGGCIYEHTAFQNLIVHPEGIAIQALQPQALTLKTRLVLDMMGHFSPIARQARSFQSPDGVCLVVGTCAQGYTHNQTGDLLVSFTPIQHQCQYFWEAFPAREGRTTYLFTYLDNHPHPISLEFLFEEYCRLLPEYQGVELSQLQFQRALFGCFPCYRQSPLHSPWNRILPIGDSSGNQSPLSFGGFGAMIRHLSRLSEGIHEALTADVLDRNSLNLLQPYQPNLAVTWLFQKTMSVNSDQTLPPNQINELLSTVFQAMDELGDEVMRPFLQDVIQFPALYRSLQSTGLNNPRVIARIIPQVGIPNLLDWSRHYGILGLYSILSPILQKLSPITTKLSPKTRYLYHRWRDAVQYGSGQDYGKKT